MANRLKVLWKDIPYLFPYNHIRDDAISLTQANYCHNSCGGQPSCMSNWVYVHTLYACLYDLARYVKFKLYEEHIEPLP